MTRLKNLLLGRNPGKTLIRCLILAVTAFLISGFWIRPVKVRGISNEPAMRNGSIQFVDLLRYRFRTPQRGDMVAIAMPGGRAFYVKRIVGMPGETVGFTEGVLRIDGAETPEPYLLTSGNWNLPETAVPSGQYFVAGDNRDTPLSGHTLGLVDMRLITGRVMP